ncbi:hypothetical protein CBR_g19369 [Chara braunii]|uniref:Uncharacterized protein n=1 Tax=Chara braunii TaxID=69332 RepID=A0A388KXS3_CHABU|nr:hypothetical protein CBR_g19369 [Chara braunii]|eukprot:GBG74856.1 hypothetical protein CBR_g19369 [Chara braunii]
MLRAVRAVNEAFKLQRRHSKEIEDTKDERFADQNQARPDEKPGTAEVSVGSPRGSGSRSGNANAGGSRGNVCSMCRRRNSFDSMDSVDEAFLHRFDRMGIDYPSKGRGSVSEEEAAAIRTRSLALRNLVQMSREPNAAAGGCGDSSASESQSPGETSTSSAILPVMPQLPFPEWHIEFSELQMGVRVGIGKSYAHHLLQAI